MSQTPERPDFFSLFDATSTSLWTALCTCSLKCGFKSIRTSSYTFKSDIPPSCSLFLRFTIPCCPVPVLSMLPSICILLQQRVAHLALSSFFHLFGFGKKLGLMKVYRKCVFADDVLIHVDDTTWPYPSAPCPSCWWTPLRCTRSRCLRTFSPHLSSFHFHPHLSTHVNPNLNVMQQIPNVLMK